MQPRRLLTSSSPGQNLCRITAAYPANDLLRPLPPQGRGLFFSNYRDTNGAVNVYGLCGFSTHWPGGHCQGTPSLTLTDKRPYWPTPHRRMIRLFLYRIPESWKVRSRSLLEGLFFSLGNLSFLGNRAN